MTGAWPHQLYTRLREFEAQSDALADRVSFSIKVRVTSGCFHREHSPKAYEAIDRAVAATAPCRAVAFVEHENGPELLVYAAFAASGLTLAKSVVDLVTAILKARSAGIKQGDRASDPLELIVRRSHDGVKANEEIILRIAATEMVDRNVLETKLLEAVRRIHADE